jgi:hypothetical protein
VSIIAALFGGIFDHFYFNIEFQATSLIFWLYVGLFLATICIAAPPDKDQDLRMPRVPILARVQRVETASSNAHAVAEDHSTQPATVPRD